MRHYKALRQQLRREEQALISDVINNLRLPWEHLSKIFTVGFDFALFFFADFSPFKRNEELVFSSIIVTCMSVCDIIARPVNVRR